MMAMRRKEKEITDSRALEEIIRTGRVLRLGLCEGAVPYIVPVCFGYEPGVFWVHSAPEGRKISILQKNPRVCFEMDEIFGIVHGEEPCRCGMKYASIVGFRKG